MKAVDYREIADDLREVIWDIEDANDTHTKFSEDRFEELKKLYNKCELFMAEFDAYKNTHNVKCDNVDWEKVIFNLNYIKNVLMHFSGSLAFLCKDKLMGHNLDLDERQFDLNFDCLCVTIKEVAEHKFEIVGGIEIYDDAGNHINTYTMEQIKKSYIEYRNNNTNKEIENL